MPVPAPAPSPPPLVFSCCVLSACVGVGDAWGFHVVVVVVVVVLVTRWTEEGMGRARGRFVC